MPVNIGLETKGTDEALAEIATLTPAAKRAATRAQNKTLRWARAQAASRLAKINNVPSRAIRGRVRSFPANPAKPYALLWLGVWPLSPSAGGNMSQTRSGARAGRNVFPGSFVATMPDGNTSIFDRARNGQRRTAGRPATSPANLPIVQQSIYLEGQDEVQAQLVDEGADRYRALMIQELNFELNVKGK